MPQKTSICMESSDDQATMRPVVKSLLQINSKATLIDLLKHGAVE